MESVLNLRSQINQLRRKNVHDEEYVPDLLLLPLINYNAVRSTLSHYIRPYFLEEVTESIVTKARRVFAILVVIDEVQIAKELLEGNLEDSKLPLPLSIQMSLEEAVAIKFIRAQWMFLAPKLNRSMLLRKLPRECILPFTTDTEIGRGSYGTVYEISLDPQHQSSENFPSRLVRKAQGRDDHSTESGNLAILSQIKHPCIIEVLGSYQYREEYNLLFPFADGGDLSSALDEEEAKPPFDSDESFYLAIAGLSSALEHVHRFVDNNLDLKLIGCHYDLKPRNILLSRGKLILADFGLARFKGYDEDSKTTMNIGNECYLAPERRNIGTRKRTKSGRSSDIWSFGCILTELMVFKVGGPEAVRQFKADRMFKDDGVRYADFHQGSEQNSAVHSWFSKLVNTASPQFRGLIRAARQMLSLNEAERPKAREVTLTLRLIVIWEKIEAIDHLFLGFPGTDLSLDLFLQVHRFEAWKHGLGIVDYISDGKIEGHQMPDETFRLTLEHLDDLHHWLQKWLKDSRALTFLESKYTEYYQDSAIQTDQSPAALSPAILAMASLKKMTALALDHSKRDQTNRQIPARLIQRGDSFHDHSIGTMTASAHEATVLIEWRWYGEQSADVVNEELFVRVECLVDLLSMEIPDGFCSLPCRGFYHDKGQRSFGVVYELPLSISSTANNCLVTLEGLMTETQAISAQPTLDDKLAIAQILSNALLEFHMVGWLHKDLSSSNVAFCFQKGTSLSEILKRPYLIGFSHSRPNEPNAFTDGPSRSSNNSFQDPRYRQANQRYRQEYDYYSLGILLLEIGCWRPLKKLTEGWNLSARDFTETLQSARVPLLGQYMGCKYRDVVDICVTGDWKVGEDTEGGETKVALQDQFQKLVIDQLGLLGRITCGNV